MTFRDDTARATAARRDQRARHRVVLASRPCAQCGTEFIPSRRNAVNCSAHRDKRRRRRHPRASTARPHPRRACDVCGEMFTVTHSKHMTCGVPCRKARAARLSLARKRDNMKAHMAISNRAVAKRRAKAIADGDGAWWAETRRKARVNSIRFEWRLRTGGEEPSDTMVALLMAAYDIRRDLKIGNHRGATVPSETRSKYLPAVAQGKEYVIWQEHEEAADTLVSDRRRRAPSRA